MKKTYIAAMLCILSVAAFGQRSISAARILIDDRTPLMRTVTLEAASPMAASYTLKYPIAPPSAPGGFTNIIAYDASGNAIFKSGLGVTTNATLIGDGTVGNPLGINLSNPNTWSALQNFGGGLTAGGSATNLNSTNTNVNGTNFTTAVGTNSTFNGPVTFNNTVSQPLPLNNLLVGNALNRAAPLTPVANRMLVTDGSGNVSWSSTFPGTVPFSQITTGSNTTATMTVGAGASVILGGGIVEASRFLGSGSTTNAVDLQTAEVGGTLTGNKGGTGLSSVDVNEVVLGNGPTGVATLDNPAGPRLLLHPGGAAVAPTWSNTIPSPVTISASQITSGTLQPGVTINVGPGSNIVPTGGGIVTANALQGAGPGNYTGTVPIPNGAVSQNIAFAGLQAGSSVVVTIEDPTMPGVNVWVTTKTPGVGFQVVYSVGYIGASGLLHYTVINP